MNRWYRERLLFLIAGTVSLIGVTLGLLVNPWGFLLNFLVGINMILFAFAGFCPMSLILKSFGIPSLREIQGERR
ncbi:YgaP family membrane protein [Leptospira stimsonii]|uniref:DUF2892 domain-containing protein n=1 Tax=Leptospira stimsonii TaxID=2202203 RepID=A0A4V3JVK4_9LEPT|nr:DUF2892 domain-containing protein [Leptospira stimsonii]RHX84207.1 hypothetical protein DLM78_19245 [Leptospira stimsonii]RHX89414.1 hypothetical protein DLM75_16455 [Leptospira stimsonii]TGK26053.1 DUF2892 domain-containing protein [Leptospira stimsonii]TGM22486.1 DUF2892 domain-containing protein [Leptospira stimsonii]